MNWFLFNDTALNLDLFHQIEFGPNYAKISGYLPACEAEETTLVTYTIKGEANVIRLHAAISGKNGAP